MSNALAGYIFCAKKNLAYGQSLVADLDQDQMILLTGPPRRTGLKSSRLGFVTPQRVSAAAI